DRGDPRNLAAARLVRGRSLPPLDRVQGSARPQTSLRRVGSAPALRAAPVPGIQGTPGSALPVDREGGGVTPRIERVRRKNGSAPGQNGLGEAPRPIAADVGPWRDFVGRWLESAGCQVADAARGDWEVTLSPALQRRWRRQRVRLVFDPLRPTLPRGAWFTAPGSGAGRKILDAACAEPLLTRKTALAQVPGAPESGIAAVCKVRGLSWAPPRLGPVRYERRVAFHLVVTLWGGLPAQEPWVMLLGPEGELIEWVRGAELADLRSREGLYQIGE